MDPPRFSALSDHVDDPVIDTHAFLANSSPYPALTDGLLIDDLPVDLQSQSTSATTMTYVPDGLGSNPWLNDGIGDGELDFLFMTASSNGGSRYHDQPTSSSSGQSLATDALSPSDDSDSSDLVLKCINQMLMEEENLEEQPWVDQIALQKAEKSLYDALGERYPDSPHLSSSPVVDSGSHFDSPHSDYSPSISSSSINSADPGNHDRAQLKQPDDSLQLNLDSSQSSDAASTVLNYSEGSVDSLNELLIRNVFNDSKSMLQFKKGLEEARKFIPSGAQLGLVINDLENDGSAPDTRKEISEAGFDEDKTNTKDLGVGSRGLKNHERDEDAAFEEGRANKQTALNVEESELSAMFDKVLLCTDDAGSMRCGDNPLLTTTTSRDSRPHGQKRGSSGGRGTRGKKQGSTNVMVDLRTLLILCAQAVSSNDIRTANELLKQIRDNSSPQGDGSQRLAHYFANGLEARLVGSNSRTQGSYSTAIASRTTAAEILKAHHLSITSRPFKKLAICFANYMILELAARASVIHIIDFGIGFGFQWPMLIQKLKDRPGGPVKLRITGIELPQPGFRPTERIEEAGHRLARYCQRFGVPFEYSALPSLNWETIKLEDLKIGSDEFVAVNSLNRFKNLLDETIEDSSPRDSMLNLIRRMKPDVFVHTIANGSYNAPFFMSRFREALYHLSAVYDSMDATISSDNKERLVFEREFFGREIMNVIACEGPERVERPETYKQWHVRLVRAGFRPVPLDRELVEKCRAMMRGRYHKDFALDEDNNWMLQGWRGRIMHGSSCWVPD